MRSSKTLKSVLALVVDAPNRIVADVSTYVAYHDNVSNLSHGWNLTGFPDYTTIVISK